MADPGRKITPWSTIAADPDVQALPQAEYDQLRRDYFNSVIVPDLPTEDIEPVWSDFDSRTRRGLLGNVEAYGRRSGLIGRVDPEADARQKAMAAQDAQFEQALKTPPVATPPTPSPAPATPPAPQPFDPEGIGYDYDTAKASGLSPDETGHWPSRDPKSGVLLKGRAHPTWNLTEQGERAAGHAITKGSDGRYYSQPSQPTALPPAPPPTPAPRLPPAAQLQRDIDQKIAQAEKDADAAQGITLEAEGLGLRLHPGTEVAVTPDFASTTTVPGADVDDFGRATDPAELQRQGAKLAPGHYLRRPSPPDEPKAPLSESLASLWDRFSLSVSALKPQAGFAIAEGELQRLRNRVTELTQGITELEKGAGYRLGAGAELRVLRSELAAAQRTLAEKEGPLAADAQQWKREVEEFAQARQYATPKNESFLGEALGTVAESSPSILAGILTLAITRNPAMAAEVGGAMGATQEGVTTYAEARGKNAPINRAQSAAVVNGLIERYADILQIKALSREGQDLMGRLLSGYATAIPAEMATEALQAANEALHYNPDMTVAEVLHRVAIAGTAAGVTTTIAAPAFGLMDGKRSQGPAPASGTGGKQPKQEPELRTAPPDSPQPGEPGLRSAPTGRATPEPELRVDADIEVSQDSRDGRTEPNLSVPSGTRIADPAAPASPQGGESRRAPVDRGQSQTDPQDPAEVTLPSAEELLQVEREPAPADSSTPQQTQADTTPPEPARADAVTQETVAEIARLETVDQAAHEAAPSPQNERPEPTEGQREAENFKMGHERIGGVDLTVQYPAGSTRSGKDAQGQDWQRKMTAHYGRIVGVPARSPDKEHVDFYLKPGTPKEHKGPVFVVNQTKQDGSFDEPKPMIGYGSREEAEQAYLANMPAGWDRYSGVAEVPLERFRVMLQGRNSFAKPVAVPPASFREQHDQMQKRRTELLSQLTAQFERDGIVEATLDNNPRVRHVLTRNTGETPYRVTGFFDGEPSGHREYNSIEQAIGEFYGATISERSPVESDTAPAQQANAAPAPATAEEGTAPPLQAPGVLPAAPKAFTRKTAELKAKTLSKAGEPSKVVPHPTEKGKFAVVPRETRPRSESQKANDAKLARARRVVDPSRDSLFAAIAKLGGINRQAVVSEWGYTDKAVSGVFGRPVLRNEGGLSIDGMLEALAELGYVKTEDGKADLHELEELFGQELRGEKVYHPSGYERQAQERQKAPEHTLSEAEFTDEELANEGYNDLSDEEQRALDDYLRLAGTVLDEGTIESIREGVSTQTDMLSARQYAAALRRAIDEEVRRVKSGKPGAGPQRRGEPADDARAQDRPDAGTVPAERAGEDQEAAAAGPALSAQEVDRRVDLTRRRTVAELTPEELRRELLISALTGLPNRRAYDEAEKKAFQAAIDLDGLKFINDFMSHAAGDQMLRDAGLAFQETGAAFYHVSGDEFVAQADDEASLHAALDRAAELMRPLVVTVTRPDGTVISKTGIGFSYGVGGTLDEAEARLQEHKAQRQAAGLRPQRGERPGGVVEIPAQGQPRQSEPEALDLTAPSETELRTRDAQQARDAEVRRQRDAAPSPEEFTLSGSNRPADVARAAGQMELAEPTPSAEGVSVSEPDQLIAQLDTLGYDVTRGGDGALETITDRRPAKELRRRAGQSYAYDEKKGAFVGLTHEFEEIHPPAEVNAIAMRLMRVLAVPEEAAAEEPVAPNPLVAAADALIQAGQAMKAAVKAEKRLQDAGENLWYNRRNFTGKAIAWDDVKNLNDTLKLKEVVKAKVWPKPNYEQLIEQGLQPFFARFIKQVYDGISTTPAGKTDADLQRYIDVVGRIREAVFDWAKDNNANRDFLDKIAERARQSGSRTFSISALAGDNSFQDVILDRVWPLEASEQRTRRYRFSGNAERTAEARVVGGNRAIQALQFTMDDAVSAMKDLDAGWPKAQEAWQRQGYKIAPSSQVRITEGRRYAKSGEATPVWNVLTSEGWNGQVISQHATQGEAEAAKAALKPFLLLDKRERLLGLFDSEAEAREAAREATKREGKGGEIRGMNIAQAERTGPQRRAENENITPERLMEVFGFRGVNFGREGWINQTERQAYLNHAYDGLMDLAEILNVPPKALSLNGMLGIAFGAQGRGGNAAAHFVPGVNEINLTKTMGAGTLAHEWGHALDHYFATQGGLAKATEPFLSEHANALDNQIAVRRARQESLPALRPEIAAAFKTVVEAMEQRPMTEAERALQDKGAKERALKSLESWLQHFRKDIERTKTSDEALTLFDQAAERLRKGDVGEGYVKVRGQTLPQVVGAIKLIVREHTKSSGVDIASNYKGLASNAEHVAYKLAQKEATQEHVPQSTRTEYAAESSKKDQEKKGKPYWRTRWEMFARAFETYVADRLEQQARSNTFLSDALLRAEQKDREGGFASPYPRGEDKVKINAAIDTLVKELKTRETDRGIALMSRRLSPLENSNFRRWFGDSKVVDEQGRPLIVYHGTPTPDFTRFKRPSGSTEPGFWFSSTPVESFARERYADRGPAIYPVYLSIQNPKEYDGWPAYVAAAQAMGKPTLMEGRKALRNSLKRAGHDGMVVRNSDTDMGGVRDDWVAFEPTQIKSAIGNSGRFDPDNADILASRAPTTPEVAKIEVLRAELLAAEDAIGKETRELNKARELARRYPRYRRAEHRDEILRRENAIARMERHVASLRRELVSAEKALDELPTLNDSRNQLPLFKQQGGLPGAALSVSDAQAQVDAITAKWRNPPLGGFTVIESADDLPQNLRDWVARQGATSDLQALYVPGSERVYLIANQVRSPEELQFLLFHETLGHFGLRGILGERYGPAMRDVYLRNAGVRRTADKLKGQYGYAKELAVEEALADLAGEGKLADSVWKQLVRWIQQALRAIGLDRAANALETMSNAEVAALLADAKRFVTDGPAHAYTEAMQPAAHRVFHGSPHDFDQFTLQKIGTGEGAQAYGWGLYFAGKKDVAEWYRNTTSRAQWFYDGKPLNKDAEIVQKDRYRLALALMDIRHADVSSVRRLREALRNETRKLREHAAFAETLYGDAMAEMYRSKADLIESNIDHITARRGRLYEVELAPTEDQYLDWDKPLDQQSEHVKAALKQLDLYREPTVVEEAGATIRIGSSQSLGSDAYHNLARTIRRERNARQREMAELGSAAILDSEQGDEELASKELLAAGIPGIKYLDGSSRHRSLRDLKREFLAELPEDASVEDVLELIGTGTFSPYNEAILKALADNEWLGFDYPAQAISAALGGQIANYDPSPELTKAIADAQQGGTHNYVIFDDSLVSITAKMSRAGQRAMPTTQPGNVYSRVARRALGALDRVLDPIGRLPDREAYLKRRYKTLGVIARFDPIGKQIRKMFTLASATDKQAVYDYLTTAEATPDGIQSPGVRAEAVTVKRLINQVGDALVRRGLLSEETREAHRDAYLPRLYLKHLLSESDWKSMGAGKKPSNMGYLKARKDIPEEVRRLILGEITDPAFLSASAIGKPLRDMALLDWLESISQNESWVLPRSVIEYRGQRVSPYWLKEEADRLRRQAEFYAPADAAEARTRATEMDAVADDALQGMPSDRKAYRQMPDTPRYGRLRGVWVRKEIYDDIAGVNDFLPTDPGLLQSVFGYGGVGTKATQLWKMGKVALNPPAQVRNFVSNAVLLQLSGVPLAKVPVRIAQAVREIASDGPHWKIAKKYGVTESTFSAQELYRIKRDLLDLQKKEGLLSAWGQVHRLGAIVAEGASDLYQKTEALFKTAKIIDVMTRGRVDSLSPRITDRDELEAVAALEAQKWMFDYSLVHKGVRYARNAPIGAPFITFQAKVLPRLLEVATLRPWRFAPWAALMWGLPAYVASQYDVDDDDLEKLKKALPEWIQKRGHALVLPWKDEEGRWQAFDLGYFFPWTYWTELQGAVRRGDWKETVSGAGVITGPVSSLIVAAMTGIDPFTNREIAHPGDPPDRQVLSWLNYLWSMSMPPVITDQGVAGHAIRAYTGETNKFGDPRATGAQAALRFFGVNLYAMEPNQTRAGNLARMEFEIEEVGKRLSQLMTNQGLTEEQKQKLGDEYRAELRRRTELLREYQQASDIHPRLETVH